MSKERAARRAHREAERAAATLARERSERRRARRRALVRRLTPKRTRRAWLLPRRSGGQRALVAGATLLVLWLVWYLVEPWALRIGLSLLVLLLAPVLVIVVFDRRV
jgi:hypothetical protein